MRDSDPTPSDLQQALFGYEPTALETALLDWTKDRWPMAARGMVYVKTEAREMVSGVSGVRGEEGKLVMEIGARVAIAERELLCRGLAAVLPAWLEETYGLTPTAEAGSDAGEAV